MADTHDMQDGKMIQAVLAVVHGDQTPEKALDLYHSLKSMEERSQYAR